MKNTICFYHCQDLDGLCSAAIIKYFKQDDVELIPFDYDYKFPWKEINRNSTVYMVDISLPANDMNLLNEMCDLVYIDHHISKLNELDLSRFRGKQDATKAACVLTWEYFSVSRVPLAVSLLGRYDIWDLDDDVLNFQNGIKIENTDPNNLYFWENLFDQHLEHNIVNSISYNGKTIRQYRETEDKNNIIRDGFEFKFRDYKVLATNVTKGGSLQFEGHPKVNDVDILMTFGWTNNRWNVSMYTKKDNIDVSQICKEYGGGGHRKAAGCHFNTFSELKSVIGEIL